MLDYAALRVLAAVVRTGSFERAAAALSLTPSAISQRVRNLEERMGAVLVERGTPCMATEKGAWLCRHIDHVAMLERDLMAHLPSIAGEIGSTGRVTLQVATNADSLDTWFIEAVADFARGSGDLVEIALDDEEHTAEWLRRGRVLAAVTSLERPVQGCRVTRLGALRYLATASPDFMARHFPRGVDRDAVCLAPALTFNRKDRLQLQWITCTFAAEIACPSHFLPSTRGFVDACLAGMGWALNPASLVAPHLASGRLVELVPGTPFDRPLFWQQSRLGSPLLGELSVAVFAAARHHLVQQAVSGRQVRN